MPRVKFAIDGMWVSGNIEVVNGRIEFSFPFCPGLQKEIKMMEGARYHGFDENNPRKMWSVKDSQRNWFQLRFLMYNPKDPTTHNPYAPYERELIPVTSDRPLYPHQLYGKSFGVTRRQCMLAWQMGCVDGDAVVSIDSNGVKDQVTLAQLYQLHPNNAKIVSLCGDHFAYHQVNDILYKGKKYTLKLTLQSGKTINLTPDHEVALGNDRWSPVEDLEPGDQVYNDYVVSVEPHRIIDVYDIVCDDPYRNFVANGIVVHNCGKTLTSIEIQEWAIESGFITEPGKDIWYVAPSAALQQVMADYEEWECVFRPQFMTYEMLVKIVDNWKPGTPAPKFVVFDESSRIKNPNARRSQAAKHVADAVRAEYGPNGFILAMSGSPAPRFPADWWHQCEVICPGFLREGTYEKFKKRLGLIVIKQNEGGVGYPHLVTWLDDEHKCLECGQYQDTIIHSHDSILTGQGHIYKKSVNEVSFLYERMNGLVDVKFKKDCLSLPDKIHQVIRVKTPQSTLNAAKIIAKRSRNTVQALTLLRELSDGFQYKEEVVDEKPCPDCYGVGTKVEKYNPEEPEEPFNQDWLVQNIALEDRTVTCNTCNGDKVVDQFAREVKQLPSPKEDALREILENHDDIGRLVVYAGFTGSVQRVTDICLSMGWHVLRVDGRGWQGYAPEGSPSFALDRKTLYKSFRYGQKTYPKMVFIGQASAAGMGLNLTASPTIVFYSNDFNFESRIQAEDRNHRPGLEKTLALHNLEQSTVIDIVNLESDMLVLNNLQKKKTLQNMSLGVMQESLESAMSKARVY